MSEWQRAINFFKVFFTVLRGLRKNIYSLWFFALAE
jgi:hypothetical protein